MSLRAIARALDCSPDTVWRDLQTVDKLSDLPVRKRPSGAPGSDSKSDAESDTAKIIPLRAQ
jgi:hypothetical protein